MGLRAVAVDVQHAEHSQQDWHLEARKYGRENMVIMSTVTEERIAVKERKYEDSGYRQQKIDVTVNKS